jgi:hypothetical protein
VFFRNLLSLRTSYSQWMMHEPNGERTLLL